MRYRACLASAEVAALHAELRSIVGTGLLLAVAALLGASVLHLVAHHSQPLIADNQRQALLERLQLLVPPGSFDNDILGDTLLIADPPLLGMDGAARVYRARRDGQPTAAAFRIVAPDGYSGDIELVMAVAPDGVVSGVRVVSHRETPGLGDDIEARRSDWIHGFAGKSLGNPNASGWRVRRDGGEFDQFSGATVTPRAVVAAVHRGLQFFRQYRLQILSADLPPGDSALSKGE